MINTFQTCTRIIAHKCLKNSVKSSCLLLKFYLLVRWLHRLLSAPKLTAMLLLTAALNLRIYNLNLRPIRFEVHAKFAQFAPQIL